LKKKTLRGLNAGRALANFENHGVAETCIAAGKVEEEEGEEEGEAIQ
jgi:hypothetical protein